MIWQRKDLLGLQELTIDEIDLILQTAAPMKDIILRPIKKVPILRGKSIVTMFYEPSTRTRTSFELAGKYLSADTVNLSMSASSVLKGETLKDTALTIEAMGADILVMRHEATGAPHFMSKLVRSRVVNGGDGMHEHPTQGLLDIFTIQQKKGTIKGLTVAILGDIYHSRVARSNIWGLTKLGAKVRVVGPSTLLPQEFKELGVEIFHRVEDALEGVDVINVLRIQKERQVRGLLPSLREYARIYCLTSERLQLAKPDALVLHPGPMNRGIEIGSQVADGLQAVINEQVTNGVAVRMAVLYLLMGGSTDEVTT